MLPSSLNRLQAITIKVPTGSAVAAAMFASAGYGWHVDSGDYPFLIDKNTRGFLENAAISEDDKNNIGYKNAERLLHLQ